MLIKAEQKFIRTSPKKLRLIARAIKSIKSPLKAVSYLEFFEKQEPSIILSKAIKQALGNAKNNFSLLPENLKIKELIVNEGPNYKRGRARSRGMVHPILKQTSHVRVILESFEKKVIPHAASPSASSVGGKQISQIKKGVKTSRKGR